MEEVIRVLEAVDPELQTKSKLNGITNLLEAGLPALNLAFNRTVNRVSPGVSALNWLFSQSNAIEKRLLALESKTEKHELEKADKASVDERFGEITKAVDKKLELVVEDICSKMDGLERRVNEMVKTANKRMGEVEVATVWRIQDCEEGLKTKVSEALLQDSLKEIERSIKEDVVLF